MTHQQLTEALKTRIHSAESGGQAKYHERNRLQEKLFVRDRIRLVLDDNSPWIEDGALGRTLDADLPGDAIVTGVGTIHGKQVAIIANDSTVKAGAWGRVTVQKILRMQDLALRSRIPVIYMQDSAGARLDEQFSIFWIGIKLGRSSTTRPKCLE
jgi:acetyl-CoA carboxylase carboxyltransferase component